MRREFGGLSLWNWLIVAVLVFVIIIAMSMIFH